MRPLAHSMTRSTGFHAIGAVIVGAALLLSGCGGGGGGTSGSGGGTPPPTGFTLGGTISGLGQNTGLVLANGGTTLTIAAGATTFSFPTPLASGTAYAVSVQSSPAGLTCSVAGGTGTITANVSNVAVTCSTNTYTLGGTVTINAPTGVTVSDQGLVLTNTGNGDTYTFLTNSASFTMPQSVPYGSAYAITVTTQPSGLLCSASNPSTTMPASNVTNVVVTCSDQNYSLGGTISGLGANSGLILTNEGNDPTTIPANATTFTMSSPVAAGSPYDVAVARVPTALNCTVTNGTGTMPASNVTSVSVGCVAGSVSVLDSLGAAGDGAKPYGALIQATDGYLYGMTQYGGAHGTGAVIKLTPAGSESVLYSFAATGDGANPQGSLIQASDGNFYGLTPAGGANGTGAVIKLTPAGAESILYSFAATGDGANPHGSLVQASDGNLYGLTASGGANNAGAVFKVSLTGTEAVIHSFGAPGDGAAPYGTLIQARDGNLYGMTAGGGVSGTGAVIEISLPADTESVLYSFAATGDGASPYGALLQANDGNFYGLTQSGGANNAGIAFKLTSVGVETVLHNFGGSGDGLHPYGSLIQASDGNLYGLAELGGAHNFGILFRMSLSGTETILHSFGASGDGSEPYGSLLQANNGGIYGTTVLGGANSLGTVFELN